VSATATSSAAIVVSWSAQTGTNAASTYTLQYRVTGSTAWSSSVTGLTQTSYTVSGLQASTGYDFSLIGVNAGGTGPVSAVVSASTLAAPIAVPGQVIGVSASPSSSSAIVVAWTGQSGSNAASTYTVQYRITGSTAWSSSVAGITQNSYTVSGLQASTSYDFSVFGVNAGGPGVVSAVASASTMAVVISAPGQVTGVTASVSSSTQIVVSWSGQIGTNAATSYTLQYRQTGTTTWGSSIPGITGDSYSVTGLTAATSYDFSILGVNAGGTGPASATISAVTQAAGSSVSSITWNVPPSGTYTHGSGAIGVNAHVTPSSAAVQFGFSTSVTVEPTSWTSGGLVNTNLWGAYVPTPATAGTWYAWVEGTDGSCPTVYPTGFVVQ
jgi:titin